MNYLQLYAQGLDSILQFAQERLYDLHLKPVLGLTDDNTSCFGRVSRNRTDDGYMPEAYYNGQYLAGNGQSVRGGLYFEKGFWVSFFALTEKTRLANSDYRAKLDYFVFTDMSIITPGYISSNTQRLDEILTDGLEEFFTYNGCGLKVTGSTFDIDKILQQYSGSQKRAALNSNLSDSGGYSSFCALKISLELRYDPGQTQGNKQVFQNKEMVITLIFFTKDTPDPTKVINVGNNVQVYQEYAPSDVLTATRVDNGKPYLQGLNVSAVVFCNAPDTKSAMVGQNSTGMYDRAGLGSPYGFNDGDFTAITFTNIS